MINQEIINELSNITDEEKHILYDDPKIKKSIYTKDKEFVVDSQLMLERGKLIDIRPHTRFLAFPKHKHNYIEIIYMCAGETTHMINDTYEVVLKQGDLLFLNQNSFHEILPAGKEDIAINFIVLPEFFDVAFRMMDDVNVLRDFLIGALRQDTSEADYLLFKVAEVLPIQNLIENMIWSLLYQSSNNRLVNQTTMGLLFLHLLNHTDKIEQNAPKQYERKIIFSVLRYIEENYKNASLGELASQLKQPMYQLSKLIKSYSGHTYKELLQVKRLNQAIYLLSSTNLSIADIIVAVGYDNTSYFHRVFKERYGVTPKEYRDKLIGK
ncbi:MAG: transcriptional regulator, AraC family [Lachnospiraceae bacterium]|jgi:AraC-like DNA-binding protein/mannose-6-phosphate isomerase-like protein (cupin superfamily)|nr:transcriptional regulator, AraC family [Lachnospiraceae bacterium]